MDYGNVTTELPGVAVQIFHIGGAVSLMCDKFLSFADSGLEVIPDLIVLGGEL